MMNKINQLFDNSKEKKLLSLYFCAGSPTLEGTADVILAMQRKGIAMVEVGIPFSDPLADGPVIQSAATKALKNGMSLSKLFAQLEAIKDQVEIPLVLMGYLNPILHYGIEAFCQSCVKAGVSGVQYRIADGSGLSLYNYVTPEILVKMLVYAYRQTKINYHLFSALPIAGQDGTLKKRMLDPVVNGRVHAKTGTLSGISSLAGYASLPNGHQLAFCIINQGVMKNTDGRGFQDKLCTALVKPF